VEEIEASGRRWYMSEAWREAARLGKKGEKYPHILVDSHGWCLRLGPRGREDEKYYSSLLNLLQGLYEHLLRRQDHESARGVLEMKNLLVRNLKEIRELGEDLEQKFPDLRRRLLDAPDKVPDLEEAGTPPLAARIAAGASESEAA
jgi:hypothetical protein